MADSKQLHCSVVTPEREVLSCDAVAVALPAHDGEIGIRNRRAPLLCKLGVGELRVDDGNEKHRFYIDGGFAQMLNNELTVLTERAEAASSIDMTAVESELAEAKNLSGADQSTREAKDIALARARARRRIASRS